MHQIVLMTALTAASGLFGGGRHHGRTNAYAYAPATCSAQAPCAARQAYAPAYAPAPQAAPVAPAPQATTYQSQYYAPASAACPTGTCPRR